MFVDSVKVYVNAGNGGRGAVAFLREAFRPKGGPCGGNGGKGGNVIIEADVNMNNLVNQHYQQHLRAGNGIPGGGKGKDGKNAEDLLLKVPCGTLIWRLPQPESAVVQPILDDNGEIDPTKATPQTVDIHKEIESESVKDLKHHYDTELRDAILVGDLMTDGEQYLLGKGGRGGQGNKNFATSRNQIPRFAQPGEAGTEDRFFLELRTIAEIGFVGYPNAGKSTLLSALSKARPKIADYPFTTLTPHIGIIEHDDYTRTTVCDIPGIIEGAHENAGLGHAFLRHIKRCKALAYLVDMSGIEGRNPWDDYRQLRSELKEYDPSLIKRKTIVLANKMDEPKAAENLEIFKKEIKRVRVIPISAAFNQGLEEVIKAFKKAAKE
jgi:GTP-binding protein